MSDEALLIVGLGNPGAQYVNTRHNAGFMLLDNFCRAHGIGMAQNKFEGIFATTRLQGKTLYLLKPQTFMNLSGKSVVACTQFYHLPIESVVVIHDELDLPLGDMRIKSGGSAGGHNGLKSIMELTGKASFTRVRLGIGRPAHDDVVNYVLGKFGSAEAEETFGATLNLGVDALNILIKEGAQAAMRFCNGLYRAKKKEEAKNGL